MGKLHTKANKLRNKRDDALREKNQALEQVSEAEAERIGLDQRREEQVEQLQQVEEQARQVCADRPDVPDGATFEQLGRRLQSMIREREDIERELGGSQEELLDKAKEAKLAFMQAKSQAHNMVKMAQVRYTELSCKPSLTATSNSNCPCRTEVFAGKSSGGILHLELVLHLATC